MTTNPPTLNRRTWAASAWASPSAAPAGWAQVESGPVDLDGGVIGRESLEVARVRREHDPPADADGVGGHDGVDGAGGAAGRWSLTPSTAIGRRGERSLRP